MVKSGGIGTMLCCTKCEGRLSTDSASADVEGSLESNCKEITRALKSSRSQLFFSSHRSLSLAR